MTMKVKFGERLVPLDEWRAAHTEEEYAELTSFDIVTVNEMAFVLVRDDGSTGGIEE